MKHFILAMSLVFLAQISLAQENTVSGYIKDASNGETLIGATVQIKGTASGVVSNVYGFYSLTLPVGKYELEYRYIGYATWTQSIDLMASNQRLDVELLTEGQQLEEVIVTDVSEDANVTDIQMSTSNLNIQTVRKMPAFMGEADVLKSIQLLPGVSTVGDGAAGFNVRGGSVGQNMVLLDEAPVYNSSHLMGFFSVFNPDAVKDVNLIKGGIPARYGGRISSVLDIRMLEGNDKEFEAQGGIGTIFSRFAVEAPIVKNKASFLVAGRRSYIDVLAKPFTEVLENGAALYFYDLTLKTNWNINPNNRVYLSAYLGNDIFRFDAQQGFNWGNRTTTLRWNHIFSDRLFSNFTAFFSDYNYALAFGEDAEDQFDWDSKVRNYDFKPEFTYFINLRNELSFGGEVSYLQFEPANAVGVSDGVPIDVSIDEKYALETAVYLSNDQKIGNDLALQYGVRYSNFALIGPGVSYTFGDTIPGRPRPLESVIEHSSGEVIASYDNFEPRISMKYQLNASSSIKASYNRTNQYIHLISNTTASNPLDVWTPSSNNIQPQTGHQVAIGWFKNFGPNNNIEFSAETYYRKTEDQIDYIDGANILINAELEGELLSGDGRAYGLELFARKNKGTVNGWVSYTLARTEMKVEGINNGNWYPTRYDQLHNFKIAAFYETQGRWSFSTNFTLVTGTPTIFPTSRYRVANNYLVPYIAGNTRNNFRIPNYHRLDLSATLQGKKFNKNGEPKKFLSYWVFSVYNVYGRKNPFSIYFAQEDIRPMPGESINTQARQVSIIGSIIPAVSYNFNF